MKKKSFTKRILSGWKLHRKIGAKLAVTLTATLLLGASVPTEADAAGTWSLDGGVATQYILNTGATYSWGTYTPGTPSLGPGNSIDGTNVTKVTIASDASVNTDVNLDANAQLTVGANGVLDLDGAFSFKTGSLAGEDIAITLGDGALAGTLNISGTINVDASNDSNADVCSAIQALNPGGAINLDGANINIAGTEGVRAINNEDAGLASIDIGLTSTNSLVSASSDGSVATGDVVAINNNTGGVINLGVAGGSITVNALYANTTAGGPVAGIASHGTVTPGAWGSGGTVTIGSTANNVTLNLAAETKNAAGTAYGIYGDTVMAYLTDSTIEAKGSTGTNFAVFGINNVNLELDNTQISGNIFAPSTILTFTGGTSSVGGSIIADTLQVTIQNGATVSALTLNGTTSNDLEIHSGGTLAAAKITAGNMLRLTNYTGGVSNLTIGANAQVQTSTANDLIIATGEIVTFDLDQTTTPLTTPGLKSTVGNDVVINGKVQVEDYQTGTSTFEIASTGVGDTVGSYAVGDVITETLDYRLTAGAGTTSTRLVGSLYANTVAERNTIITALESTNKEALRTVVNDAGATGTALTFQNQLKQSSAIQADQLTQQFTPSMAFATFANTVAMSNQTLDIVDHQLNDTWSTFYGDSVMLGNNTMRGQEKKEKAKKETVKKKAAEVLPPGAIVLGEEYVEGEVISGGSFFPRGRGVASYLARYAIPNRLQLLSQNLNTWFVGYGLNGSQNMKDGIVGYNTESYGFAFGMDRHAWHGNLRAGISYGYADGKLTSDDVNGFGSTPSLIDTKNHTLLLYSHLRLGCNWFLTGKLGGNWGDIDGTRRPTASTVNNYNTSSATFITSTSLGFHLIRRPNCVITPRFNYSYFGYAQSGYTETGSGPIATVGGFDAGISEFSFICDWKQRISDNIAFNTSLGYRYMTDDGAMAMNVNIAGLTDPVPVTGMAPTSNIFVCDLGMDFRLTPQMFVTGKYNLRAGDGGNTLHGGTATLAFDF